MATTTVENYLKQLYLLQQRSSRHVVPLGKLATSMGVTPGTATTMVKALAESGLVHYTPRSGARLSDAGAKLALHVLRRHRLVELFLVEVLGLDWAEVHEEAEELEHAVSDKLLEKIDAFLGRPTVDPHGDPIPTARGTIKRAPRRSLADCPLQQKMRVARVLDQRAAFLRFADRHGLTPGVDLVVRRRDEAADAVTVQPTGRPDVTVGAAAAAKILVEPG